jgi:hypothetical protein
MVLKIFTVATLCVSLNGCSASNEIVTGSLLSSAPGIQSEHISPAQRTVKADDGLAILCQKRLDDAGTALKSERGLTVIQRQANERACAQWQADRNRIAAEQ